MEQKTTKPARSSNIELLRILAILGVIILHYNNSSIGGGFAAVAGGSLNQNILILLECAAICAVNVFVMISGFFMSGSDNRTLWKPIGLVTEVVVMNIAIYLANRAINKSFSFRDLFYAAIPENYFVVLFCVLYIVSPYINLLLNSMSDKKLKVFLALLILIFSVYQTFISVAGTVLDKSLFGLSPVSNSGGQGGYTIVNFIMMYIVGACIRRFNVSPSLKKLLLALLLLVAALFVWAKLNILRSLSIGKVVWAYNNPLVIALAAVVFLIFKRIKLGNLRAVNFVAKASFTVFLTHAFFFRFINIPRYVKTSALTMTAHVFVSAILIYAAGVAIYFIYENTVGRMLDLLQKKLPIKDIWKIS
ncbi:MAG: acyltransferase family protein [Oscillospiraceae bacterium]|nr:acyltransferase family protein [Oscillospiraceae bacterium]